MVKDVVCGMQIDPNEAAGKSEYQGQTYYSAPPDASASSTPTHSSS